MLTFQADDKEDDEDEVDSFVSKKHEAFESTLGQRLLSPVSSTSLTSCNPALTAGSYYCSITVRQGLD